MPITGRIVKRSAAQFKQTARHHLKQLSRSVFVELIQALEIRVAMLRHRAGINTLHGYSERQVAKHRHRAVRREPLSVNP
jgi:hypothetical protein